MTHTCPRRRENGMDRGDGPFKGAGKNLDTYEPNHGLVGQPAGCSYCGSMSPQDFMHAVVEGKEIGPTDKSYKLYVRGLENPNPEQLYVLSSGPDNGRGAKHWNDLNEEEREAVTGGREPSEYDQGRYYTFRTQPVLEGKFYTSHLTESQGYEFWNMAQLGKVNWGYPGYPYVPLYIPGPSTQKADDS